MSTVKQYLEDLQKSESIFPIDSVHSGKLPDDKVIYGKSKKKNEDDDII